MAAEESRECGPGCHPQWRFEQAIATAKKWARAEKAYRLFKRFYEKEKKDCLEGKKEMLPSDENCMDDCLILAHDNLKRAKEANKAAMDAVDPLTRPIECRCISYGEQKAYFCYIAFILGTPDHQIRKDLECASKLINEAVDAGKDQKRGLELIGIMQSQIDPA